MRLLVLQQSWTFTYNKKNLNNVKKYWFYFRLLPPATNCDFARILLHQLENNWKWWDQRSEEKHHISYLISYSSVELKFRHTVRAHIGPHPQTIFFLFCCFIRFLRILIGALCMYEQCAHCALHFILCGRSINMWYVCIALMNIYFELKCATNT